MQKERSEYNAPPAIRERGGGYSHTCSPKELLTHIEQKTGGEVQTKYGTLRPDQNKRVQEKG